MVTALLAVPPRRKGVDVPMRFSHSRCYKSHKRSIHHRTQNPKGIDLGGDYSDPYLASLASSPVHQTAYRLTAAPSASQSSPYCAGMRQVQTTRLALIRKGIGQHCV